MQLGRDTLKLIIKTDTDIKTDTASPQRELEVGVDIINYFLLSWEV